MADGIEIQSQDIRVAKSYLGGIVCESLLSCISLCVSLGSCVLLGVSLGSCVSLCNLGVVVGSDKGSIELPTSE